MCMHYASLLGKDACAADIAFEQPATIKVSSREWRSYTCADMLTEAGLYVTA